MEHTDSQVLPQNLKGLGELLVKLLEDPNAEQQPGTTGLKLTELTELHDQKDDSELAESIWEVIRNCHSVRIVSIHINERGNV